MATKFYFHAANSSLVNLPTTKQSSITVDINVDALTVNRSMDTTIGTSQVTLTTNSLGQSAQQNMYFTRFVSPALNMSSIPAQTWTYNFAANPNNTFANFPVNGNNQPIHICCYVWRPGTGKLGNILDGNSASVYDEPNTNAERSMHGTFSGSAVNSMQSGDVLVFEMWARFSQNNNTVRVVNVYFDGTTENATENAAVTNHASFLDSPQTFTFASTDIDMTPNAVVRVYPKPIKII